MSREFSPQRNLHLHLHLRERWLPATLLILLAAGSGWLGWVAWVRPELAQTLRITGGRLPGPRQKIVESLAEASTARGLRLDVRECPGSVEALDRVNQRQVDVALVQGGLDSRPWTEVQLVAALHVEPLQLVVKRSLYASVAANPSALRDRSINVGEPGSGSNALARSVLAFVGLGPADYRAGTLTHEELMAIDSEDRLPDAVMTVGSLPTPVIKQMVARWGYRLVPLPFAEAFALEDLFEKDATRVEPAASRVMIDKVHIHPTLVPAYTYGVEPAEPSGALATIGARVLVVAHRKTSPEAVKRLLEAIFLSDFSQIARPPLDPSLLDLPPEFPFHAGTLEFQSRNKPLIFGDLLEWLEKVSSFGSVMVGGVFLAWQWGKRRYQRRRELGFEAYLWKVTAIERQAMELELSPRLELGSLLALQSELSQLKNKAMERFTTGDLEGEGLMSGFLTHANDARDYLARLILHARTSIEKRARRKGISAEVAWDQALEGGSEG